MMNNLIPYKKGIINWLKTMFFRRKNKQEVEEKNDNLVFNSMDIRDRVAIPKDKERTRLLKLREQWEAGNIDAEDISDEDVDKIVEIYNKETEKINNETLLIKENISKMLKELKNEG